MNKEEKIVMLKLDVIFKRVFGNDSNKAIIAAFISDLLEIPRESIKAIYINNVELTPEYLDMKFSRLDLRLDVDGRIVNIEMQVNREADFKERTLFYWSKLYSEELKTGEEYGELKQTICINIINFDLFDCEDYHSRFKVLETERHEVLTDKFAIHFFELKKLGKFKKNKRMEDWLNLINAETEGDLMAIQQTTQIPEVKDTIVMLRQLKPYIIKTGSVPNGTLFLFVNDLTYLPISLLSRRSQRSRELTLFRGRAQRTYAATPVLLGRICCSVPYRYPPPQTDL